MSVCIEVKRTLVKSPPELWSELSDPESLARHLDGIQQIRITRTDPEAAVEWEADGASGSVHLQPSGFGTKVTLSLSRELPTPPASEPCVPEPEFEAIVTEPDPEPAGAEPDPEPAGAEPQPDPAVEAPPQGFFARLFKRRRKPATPFVEATPIVEGVELSHDAEPERVEPTEPQPEISAPVESAVAEPTLAEPTVAEPTAVESEPVEAQAEANETVVAADRAPDPVEPQVSVAADLAALEAEMGEQDEAMLIAMLDRLGSAHHRPFSRS